METIRGDSTCLNENQTNAESKSKMIFRLHKRMVNVQLLKNTGVPIVERIHELKKLKEQIDTFERVMIEQYPQLDRLSRTYIRVANEMCATKNLLKNSRLQRPKIGPVKLNQKRPPWRGWKGFVLVSAFLLIAAAVTTLSFGWHRDLFRWSDSEVAYPTTETYCEALNRLKCENGGYPSYKGHGFACQCVDDYFGERCANDSYFMAVTRYMMEHLFDSTNSNLRRGMLRKPWSFLPFIPDLQKTTIISFYREQLRQIKNRSFLGSGDVLTSIRILPPTCPMYRSDDDKLPPLDMVYDEIFRRKPEDLLKRDPKRRNMLYHTFYLYFVLQFFNADFNATVTGSQLYGADETARKELRSFAGGKLKTERYRVNNKHYPSRLSTVRKFMSNVFSRMSIGDGPTQWFDGAPGHATTGRNWNDHWWDVLANMQRPHHRWWAVGHPLSSMTPMLFAMDALWVREHNRVCDHLAARWPRWTDERLYGTAKRAVVGQMMGIMMNDVLNADGGHRWPLKYRPDEVWPRDVGDRFATTPLEALLTIMMMPSGGGVPEQFEHTLQANSPVFGDNSQVWEGSMGDMVRLMVDQPMGLMSSNNHGTATEPLTKVLMKMSRENGVQSFNRYRVHLGLRAYGSFHELTGSRETAGKLESLYGNVDNVELLAGMIAEKTSDNCFPTFTVMVNSFIVNSIATNSLYSKTMRWNSDTFDGDYGFSVAESASIRTFVCNNLQDECNDGLIVDLFVK